MAQRRTVKPREEKNVSFKKSAVFILFAVALALKLGFLILARDNPFVLIPANDEVQHLATARGIASHGLIQDDAFYFAPLYPYVLAPFVALLGDKLFLFRAMQSVAGAVNVIVMFYLALLVFENVRAAWIASILTLFHGVYYPYETLLLKTTFAVLLTNLAIVSLYSCLKKPGRFKWAFSGWLFGLLCLLRGNALVLLPLILLGLLLDWKKRGISWLGVLLWVGGAAVGIAPATIHNAIAAKNFVPTTYDGGTNFYIGNNENANGEYIPLRMRRQTATEEKTDAVSIAEEAAGGKLKPSEVSNYWLKRSLDWMRSNPADWTRLTFRKFLMFHSNREYEDTVSFQVFRELEPVLWITFIPFGLLVGLSVGGLMVSLGRWRDHLMLYLILLGMMASVVLFFIFTRYRIPTTTVYILFASLGLAEFTKGARASETRAELDSLRKRKGFLLPLLTFVGFIAAAAAFPVLLKSPSTPPARLTLIASASLAVILYVTLSGERRLRRLTILVSLSVLAFESTLLTRPSPPDSSYNNLGVAYLKLGDYERARERFEQALQVSKGRERSVYLNNMAHLMKMMGKPEEALKFGREHLGNLFKEESARDDVALQQEIVEFMEFQIGLLGAAGQTEEKSILESNLQTRIARLLPAAESSGLSEFELGELEARARDFDAALRHFKNVAPLDAETCIEIGLIHKEQRNWNAALEAFQQARTLDPDNPYVHLLLGNVQFMSGDKKAALASWKRSLELDPKQDALRKNLQNLERQMAE